MWKSCGVFRFTEHSKQTECALLEVRIVQGGEAVPSAETVEKIEHILQPVEKAVAEITVVNYPDCAV